ncbi:MliC family protein [Phenylobacterium deserti]|nr:MliC family protein [Phenylobacterium deserti]
MASGQPVNPDPGVRTYLCENGETIEAGYPDDSSAMVRYRGRPIPMKAARAASGVRYVGYGLQWWTRGMDEGRLSVLKDGEDIASDPGITCRVGGTPKPTTPAPATQDPGAEAAGVARAWFARAAAGRATDADWTEAGQASRAALLEQMAAFETLAAEVGPPGAVQGAAGSLYVEMPLSLNGRLKAGGETERTGKVVMRRINDVPGSTGAQRRWRIERVDLERPAGG